ncbi:MAG: carboxypeptidase-like regulatory domain-containing protein [Pyrinomonadaceae bacterium]
MRFSYLKRNVFLALTSMMVLAFMAGSILGQAGTSAVRGTVTDQNGAAVPGATVRLSNPETGFNRSASTSDEGTFAFPGIPPASYRLEVEAANFKKLVSTSVQALVDSPIELRFALELGSVTAVVDVTSNTIESVVNNQDASLGNNFVPQQISELPTDLRRVADLLTLQPGVTREGYVAGGRSDQANVLLDGVDINDQQNGGRTAQFQTSQDTVLRATTESVEEFRITTSNANANQGRSSGAQISLITKSGTNSLRGSLFYFYRPTAFSANSFFNNAAGTYEADDDAVINGFANVGDERAPRPSLARDVFGGSIGGPILKDRLFFFYTYEGQRQEEGVSVVRTVPLAHLGQAEVRFMGAAPGDPAGTNRLISLSAADLNVIFPAVGLNPAALSVLADAASRYPANDTTVGDGINTGGFRFNAATTSEENTHIARFDYKINDNQGLYLRGNYQNDILTGTSQFPDTVATTLWDHPYGFVVGHDMAISSNMVNNFRYGLTRQAFSTQGDSSDSAISFRFVFSPLAFARTLSRITPTHNITDDFTWIKGNHTLQFGGNVRIIRNQRVDFGSAFDSAVTNPSFYDLSGRILDRAVTAAGYTVPSAQRSIVQNGTTAVIGRFSQYSGNFTFDIDGSTVPAGTPTERTFATEEYDAYVSDAWKLKRNLTLTMGVRYSISRPVYESTGFQVVPTVGLGDYFDRRVASSAQGVPFNDLIQFERGGPANNGPGFYKMDWNNWQPRVAIAWSPSFKDGFLGSLFGRNEETVIRGGIGITADHFGGQLAVSFDGLSTIGFTSSSTIAANTYNVTDNPAPRFTGFDQDVRSLPGIPIPVQRFETPADEAQRIETSLDSTIKTPKHYSWNVSIGRQLPWGMYAEASYIGRKARNLLASRDVMALNNLVDPQSRTDWYTAAGMLHDLRAANTHVDNIQPIPYFENLFPGLGDNFWGIPEWSSTQAVFQIVAREDFTGFEFFDVLDWTFVQALIDDLGVFPNMFFHPQYAAFSAFGSTAESDYNGATFSLRQRLGETLSYDFNYTWAKSFDSASGLQTGGSYGSQFILNPLRPQDNYSVSDFDTRHSINANFIFQLPVGKGKKYFSGMNSFADVFLGGWQMSGIYRWNTGLPIFSPFDSAQWATNWNAQSSGVRVRDTQIQVNRDTQSAFADAQAAYNSWRNARPGETGDRNVLRLPGYSTLDLGLSKSFRMPWSEDHKLQFRTEVINVSNTQYFNADQFTRSTWGLGQDSDISDASSDFGKIFTSIQGVPRRVQFGLRYSF